MAALLLDILLNILVVAQSVALNVALVVVPAVIVPVVALVSVRLLFGWLIISYHKSRSPAFFLTYYLFSLSLS